MVIQTEGKKRRIFFKEIRMTDAGQFTCSTNADQTTAEVTVDCELLSLIIYLSKKNNSWCLKTIFGRNDNCLIECADVNKFNKKLKDTTVIEREKVILEVEVADLTANAEFFFNGQPIVPSERIEVKNLGGGKHQLIFNPVDLADQGEIKCRSGKLKSTCQLTVSKGETKPQINLEGPVEGPAGKPLVIDVPYSGN